MDVWWKSKTDVLDKILYNFNGLKIASRLASTKCFGLYYVMTDMSCIIALTFIHWFSARWVVIISLLVLEVVHVDVKGKKIFCPFFMK